MTSTIDKIPSLVTPGQIIVPEYGVEEKQQNQDKEDIVSEPVIIKYICGEGTKLIKYRVDNEGSSQSIDVITSTRVGTVRLSTVQTTGQQAEDTSDKMKNDDAGDSQDKKGDYQLVKVSVHKGDEEDSSPNLPKEGDVVLCRVSRVSLQRANVEILAVGSRNIPVDGGFGSNGGGIVAPGGGSGGITFSISQASSDLGETFKGIIRSQDVRATERDKVKMVDCFKPSDIVKAQVLSLGDGNYYYLTTARDDLGVVFAKAYNGAGGLMYPIDWQTMVAPSTGTVEKRKCAKPFL